MLQKYNCGQCNNLSPICAGIQNEHISDHQSLQLLKSPTQLIELPLCTAADEEVQNNVLFCVFLILHNRFCQYLYEYS